MIALIVWGSMVTYFCVGAFVAGRTWLNLKARDYRMDQEGAAVLTVIVSFIFWWAFLVAIFSIWSARKGLASNDTLRLIKEKESDELRRRIAKRERKLAELENPKLNSHNW